MTSRAIPELPAGQHKIRLGWLARPLTLTGKRDFWLVVGFSLAFFSATGLLASRRLLWTDEIVTYHLATQPTCADVWSALCSGPDTLPPLSHFLTRASCWLLGTGEWAIRFPSIAGFWLMCVCNFCIVRHWCPTPYACIAMCFPVVTASYGYSLEARPYGLVLGFSAAALLCWQIACDRSTFRWLALLGLAACLALAVSSHWYAVLLFVPLGLGNLVRAVGSRRLDVPAWGALVAGLFPLLLFQPMLQNARTFMPVMSSWHFSLAPILSAYASMLNSSSSTLALLASVLVLALGVRQTAPQVDGHSECEPPRPVPPYSLVALLGVLGIPILGALLALTLTGVYKTGYVLPTLCAICVLLSLAMSTLARGGRNPHHGFALLGVVAVAAVVNVYYTKMAMRERSDVALGKGSFAIVKSADALRDCELPIVVTDPHAFFELQYYCPTALANKLVFVCGDRVQESDLLQRMRPWATWRVEDYEPFLKNNKTFYVYDCQSPGRMNSPFLASLLARGGRASDGGHLEVRDVYLRPGYLYRITFTNDSNLHRPEAWPGS
jgi:hypothetical protein